LEIKYPGGLGSHFWWAQSWKYGKKPWVQTPCDKTKFPTKYKTADPFDGYDSLKNGGCGDVTMSKYKAKEAASLWFVPKEGHNDANGPYRHGHHTFLFWCLPFLLLLLLILCCKHCCCRRRYDVVTLHETYTNLYDDDDALNRVLALSVAESSSPASLKPVDVPLVPGAPKPPPGVVFGSATQV